MDRCCIVPGLSAKLLPYRGLCLAVTGAFLLAINACLVKSLSTMQAPAIALSREVVLFSLSLPMFIWSDLPFLSPPGTRLHLLFRSLFGALAFLCYFFALKLMSVADVAVISSTTPVAVTLLARIFLGKADEATDCVHWLCMGMSIIGLVILSRLPDMIFAGSFAASSKDIQYWFGFVAAIASTILGAAVIVFLRQLRKVNILVVQINHTCIAMCELLAINMAVSPWIPPSFPRCNYLDGFFLVTISVLTLFAQLSLTASLKTEQAGPVALVRFAGRVFFVFILQVLFLDDIPDVHSISAAALVLTSMVLSTYRRYRLQKKKQATEKSEELVNEQEVVETASQEKKPERESSV